MNKSLSQFEKMTESILELKNVSEKSLYEPIKQGKWSIIQIVQHLYYWDKFNLEKMVPHFGEGNNLPPFPDHEQHNKEAMSYVKDYSASSIIDHFVLTRKRLCEEISKVDKGVRFTIGEGKRKFSGESFVKIFIKHDAHHLKQINEKLN
ncbi:DinB family protein [Halalkalibacter akibai]|uniref:DinB-like domain-containing protein n=1 Tax=Halalkalibacter akibai (strain ATCC 43226 / DSM 21942 / CIP 109018 / JCM 9157 / 1139) TaxID=1236973 RepID=W4QP33_HALA3|nr:DinB family protein [Halalkalibacter akibai]GAE33667.1 hypothetical protein JCM9157_687 [Halalkalibacter akibai JCM 9157]